MTSCASEAALRVPEVLTTSTEMPLSRGSRLRDRERVHGPMPCSMQFEHSPLGVPDVVVVCFGALERS